MVAITTFWWKENAKGRRGTLIFSSYVGSGPASTVHPQKYKLFQTPQKIFEILTKDPKMHRNDH